MNAVSATAPSEARIPSAFVAGVTRVLVRPLQLLVSVPSLLFLAALTAMLFSHPDVPFHELNRLTFGLLLLGVVGRAVILREKAFRLERASWAMAALTAVVLLSMIGRPLDRESWSVFAAKYLFPFTLFHLAQTVFADEEEFRKLEVFAAFVLAYLSFTSIAFLVGARELVFPAFILDPSLGHHADRARGPFLQAVANGVSLNILGLIAFHGYQRGSLKGAKSLLLLASVPVAILATMTRAVWLSFAGSVLAVLFLSRNARLRVAFIAVMVVAVLGFGAVMATTELGTSLGDRLEESGPVDYRKAVYAGGWEMFLEHPLTGRGFHQMPADLPKYVTEYKAKVLYPHNTYLEVLVENGLLGLALYCWLMWELWRLGIGVIPERDENGFLNREFHAIWPILLAVYWVNAAVVVMSYHFVNGILFSLAGMLSAQQRRAVSESAC